MIEIHLYGDLRSHAAQSRANQSSVVQLPSEGTLTIAQVLQRVGIAADEISQVFLNGQLLDTCFGMAPWLGYTDAAERLPAGGDCMETMVQDGDRLGLFPPNMAILVV